MKPFIAKIISFPIPHKKTRRQFRQWLENLDFATPLRIIKIVCVRRHNTIFLIEANPFHAECMYSVFKHFTENNQNVIILTTKQNIEKNLFPKNVKLYCIQPFDLRILDFIHFFNTAKSVFVNSYFIWKTQSTANKYFVNYIKKDKTLIAIDHAPNFYDYTLPVPENVYRFVLSDFMSKKYGYPVFYTFDFPASVNINVQNRKFISVGVIGDNLRRDMDSYLNILDTKPEMFSYIISSFIFPNYKIRLQNLKNIQVYEQASFSQLFECCRAATFIPFLIHDESLDLYKDRITGNINLVLGFGLIPIIDKKLATLYNITDDTGILYSGRKELNDAIERALHMPHDKIQQMRKNILKMAQNLRAKNADTMNAIIR